MKLFADKNIKTLFTVLLAEMFFFLVLFAALLGFSSQNAPQKNGLLMILLLFFCALFMALSMIAACFFYFSGQEKILDNASEKVSSYISDGGMLSLDCNSEGALFRLFHEINSLASILNTHIERESDSKEFLKDTISDVSHQLKTPLAALNIYNGILMDESENLPTIQEFAALSEKELDRIEVLVQNLLKITKLDAGTMVMNKKPENLVKLLCDVKEHFAFRAQQEEKILSLTVRTDERSSLVASLANKDDETLCEEIVFLCDRIWLVEALDNIVKNALDHTSQGDSISIELIRSSALIQIVIRDSGCGIHPEDLYHIFKRFYRSRFSKDTSGLGLGLPLAKAIIEAHDGAIEVDSTLGVGTTFTVNFLFPTNL